MRPEDLPEVIAFDAAAFGCPRSIILKNLFEREPALAKVCRHPDGAVAGYVLGRDGRLARQLGPLVANDATDARMLLAATLASIDGPVFIDVPDNQALILQDLSAAGFERQRGFTRMALNRDQPYDDVARIFAIAGPELG